MRVGLACPDESCSQTQQCGESEAHGGQMKTSRAKVTGRDDSNQWSKTQQMTTQMARQIFISALAASSRVWLWQDATIYS